MDVDKRVYDFLSTASVHEQSIRVITPIMNTKYGDNSKTHPHRQTTFYGNDKEKLHKFLTKLQWSIPKSSEIVTNSS